MESDLGGGNHGYLGLVLTDTEYTTISATPFVAPRYPAAHVIPRGTDQVQALKLCEQHKEDKRAYYKCKNIKKALQHHVQDKIKDKYLKSLLNDNTQLIQEESPMS